MKSHNNMPGCMAMKASRSAYQHQDVTPSTTREPSPCYWLNCLHLKRPYRVQIREIFQQSFVHAKQQRTLHQEARTICVLKSLQVMLSDSLLRITRNLGVAPLMLWTPLILRRYLTIVCFWPFFRPFRSCFGFNSNWSLQWRATHDHGIRQS